MDKVHSGSDLMRLAIDQHLMCREYPRVGAVIAKAGRVLSTGYRGERKNIHAERVAIEKLCKDDLLDAVIYTTLEPCIKIHNDQGIESCADLIIASGIREVVIGVLDPNGSIYAQGYKKLLESNISIAFFSKKYREAIDEETFEYGQLDKIIGSGKRRLPVVQSGTSLEVQFSVDDTRIIPICWNTLQFQHECVDVTSENGAVRVAVGASNLSQITDPMVFRFPSHVARMKKGMIAIIKPDRSTFCVLIKLLDIYPNDILFQWESRNIK